MMNKTVARVRVWGLLLSALWLTAAAADELRPYTVVDGDTCASIARKVLGDAHKVDQIHAHNALGPAPHHLKAGQILQLPFADATPTGPDALVTYVRNSVEKYTPDRAQAKSNDPLFRGNRVNTLASSSAEVTFGDQTQIQLGADTLVVILGEASGKRANRATSSDATLLNGALRAHLAELAGKSTARTIATPSGRVHLLDGESQVSVDEQKATRLAVYRGKSRLKASGTELAVPAGYGSKAEAGQPPSSPKPLPRAPSWQPAPETLLLTVDEGTFTATYAPPADGPPAALWHVQLGRDERFNDLLLDNRVPAAVTRLQVHRLSPGRYFVRISGIDDDRFEGAFSAALAVEVAKVEVGASSVTVDGRYQCSIDGVAQSGSTLTVDRATEHRLTCVALGAAGRTGQLRIAAARPELVLRGSLDQIDTTARRARLVVNAVDAQGQPARGRQLTASGNATVSPLVEIDGGLYVAQVSWPAGTTALDLRLAAAGTTVVQPVAVRLAR